MAQSEISFCRNCGDVRPSLRRHSCEDELGEHNFPAVRLDRCQEFRTRLFARASHDPRHRSGNFAGGVKLCLTGQSANHVAIECLYVAAFNEEAVARGQL